MGELSARLIAHGDAVDWDRLASAHGTVFTSGRWTQLFEPGLKRFVIFDVSERLLGGFCVFEQRHFGLRVLRRPPFTPDVGPFFESRARNPAARTTEQRAVVEAMARSLDSSKAAVISLGLSLRIEDCLPFYWRRFKVVPHYTYRIDLIQDEAVIVGAFSQERRNDVRKAMRDGIVAEEVTDTAELRRLVLETFSRKSKSFPLDAMDRILRAYPPGQDSFCYIATDRGEAMAGVYVVHDTRTAYYLLGGYGSKAHRGAGALALHHAILKAKRMNLQVFDFEGSVEPGIEKFFRGFGGQLTSIFGVHKAWFPLEVALKLVKPGIF